MRSKPRYSSQQRRVLFVCVAIFALGQFHRASGGVFTPILMDRFALTAATVGAVVSAMFVATIAAQVPFGIALDKRGPRAVLSLCIVTIAFGTLAFAFGNSVSWIIVSRILIGIGLAAMGAATHVIIARNFDKADFGYMSGMVVTLGGIGGLLGTYPLAFALERVSWSAVFAVAALVTFLLAGIVLRAVRPGPANSPTADELAPNEGFAGLLSRPEFMKILALGTVTFAPITTITGLWGGPFLQDIVALSPEHAGFVLLLLFSATIAAGYVFGMLDRNAASRKRVILGAVALSSAALWALALLPTQHPFVSIALLLAMVFLQQFYIPLGAHMRLVVPDHLLGRASTLLSLVSVAAIPAMQFGFGAILDFADGLGWDAENQYRLAFAAMACLIALCGGIYAFAKSADVEKPRQT